MDTERIERMSPDNSWLLKLMRLKVYRARGGPAPHKPLLLLVVLDMGERGELAGATLPLTPELAFRFCAYWPIVARRRNQRPDVRLPFYPLGSDGFWRPLRDGGQPAADNRHATSAALDPEFLRLTSDPGWRERARRTLIATYFPAGRRSAVNVAERSMPLSPSASARYNTCESRTNRDFQ